VLRFARSNHLELHLGFESGKACRPVFLIALLAAHRLHASGPVDGMPQSAHDLLYRSDGALYLTGSKAVFSLHEGKLQAMDKDLTQPRGIALAPDEKSLYVTDRNSVVRYLANTDGTLSNGQVIAEIESVGGIQVDREGNSYIACADGVWIISSEGAMRIARRCTWYRPKLYIVSGSVCRAQREEIGSEND